MVKRQIDISSYTRVKNDKIENVRKHVRSIDTTKINKNTLKDIKTGKAKRITTKEFLSEFKDTSKTKDKSLESFKTGEAQKGILGFAGISEKAMDLGLKASEQTKHKKLTDFTINNDFHTWKLAKLKRIEEIKKIKNPEEALKKAIEAEKEFMAIKKNHPSWFSLQNEFPLLISDIKSKTQKSKKEVSKKQQIRQEIIDSLRNPHEGNLKLSQLKVYQLKDIAKDLGIIGLSRLNKIDLIQEINKEVFPEKFSETEIKTKPKNLKQIIEVEVKKTIEAMKKEKPKSTTKKIILPEIKAGEKYYVIDKDSHAYLKYTTKPDIARELLKKYNNIEIIAGKKMDDVRDKIFGRGREYYTITGETYKNRNDIKKNYTIKFDYENKAYRGKFSPTEIAEVRKIEGIEVKKSNEMTEDEKIDSKIARLDSRTSRYLKHQRKEGTIWQKKNPFSKEQNSSYDNLTWVFNISGGENRLNEYFQDMINSKENEIKSRLKIKDVKESSENIQNAYDRYRKESYNFVLSKLNQHQTAPSMAVTGSSGYKNAKYRFDKRDRMEKSARDKLAKITKTMDKTIEKEILISKLQK